MKNEKNLLSLAGQARREAGSVLQKPGMRLQLAVAWLICLCAASPYFLLYRCAAMLLSAFTGRGADPYPSGGSYYAVMTAYFALIAVWTVFFAFPLFIGVCRISFLAERRAHSSLSEILYAFSSRSAFGRVLRLSFGAFWRLAGIALAVVVTYRAVGGGGRLWMNLLCALLILAELAVGVLLCSGSFFVLYAAFEKAELPMAEIRKAAKQMAKENRFAGVYFGMDGLPWLLLSFATIGILLLADFLPRMPLSYFRFCRKAEGLEYQPEVPENYE